jgi:hypothetical protein
LVDQLSRYGFPLAALVVMILTAIAVNSPRMKALLGGQTADRQDDPDILGDSPDFRNAFATWAPLVLARRGSPRAVKRFANRMRYLVADPEGTATADQIRGLMALGALDEIGAIWPDMTIGRHTGHKAFRCWLKPSNDVLQELQKNADSPDTFNDTLNAIDAETWAEYWELAQSVRFSDGGGSETAAAASGRA